jgi:two-component system, cell cycle response regulator
VSAPASTTDDIERDNRRLREQLAVLKAEAASNETIMRRAQARELELLRCESLEALLERFVGYLADSYGLAAVSVVLLDPHHELRHLLMGNGRSEADFPGVLFTDRLADAAPALETLRRPWLGPFVSDQHGPLFPRQGALGSVALLPLRREERAIGCLAFGAHDAQRFTRHLATDFLSHLAVIAAVCVESAVNRARLVRSGMTDALTGWHNRRYFENRLLEELARARREQRPLSCLMLDVDYFKRVNDGYGHLAGDRLLREVTHRIEGQVRASDVTARYGGEEFVVLLPATRVADAVALAERVRAAVSASPVQIVDGKAVTVTVSIGVASRVPAPMEADLDAAGEGLVRSADAALYRAKATGRDRVCQSG